MRKAREPNDKLDRATDKTLAVIDNIFNIRQDRAVQALFVFFQ